MKKITDPINECYQTAKGRNLPVFAVFKVKFCFMVTLKAYLMKATRIVEVTVQVPVRESVFMR